ncbi:hypothetical protein [Candidatus Chlorohelix sp.]|uniref:hypothetical protein n=1 Tax=Candidatus Chlorohelix sp. TaxID=3139201 RepID=UPI003033EA1F
MAEITSQIPQNAEQFSSKGRVFLKHLFIIILYLVGALVFTLPLAFNLSNKVIYADGEDVWVHIWHIWWARYSLFEQFINPFYTRLIYHPVGVGLYFQPLTLPNGILSTPFQYLLGLIPAFNLLFIFNVTLAGYTAFLLGKYLSGSSAAGLVTGTVYAFSPLESSLLDLGQLEQISIGWFPLFLLFFLKYMRQERRSRLNLTLAILLLLLVSMVTWYHALFAWLFCGLYLLFSLLISSGWKARLAEIKRFALLFAIYGVLIAPVLLPTLVSTKESGNAVEQPLLTIAYNSATLLGFVAPGPSPIWNIAGFSGNYQQNYLGYVALILAAVGVFTAFKKYWFWLAIAAIFLLLSFGPALQITANPELTQAEFDSLLPMPARLLYSLPLVNISRVPVRFMLLVMLALGVLAGVGVKWLLARVTLSSGRKWLSVVFTTLVVGLIFLEFMPAPRNLGSTDIPDFYNQLQKNGNTAIMELPAKAISRSMYFETSHQLPIVGGYIARAVSYELDNVPGIRELRFLRLPSFQRDIIDLTTLSNTPAALRYYNIGYLVLHPSYLKTEPINRILRTTIGSDQPCLDIPAQDITVYCLPPETPGKSPASQIMLNLGDGWLDRIVTATGEVQRTTSGGDTQLVVFNPSRIEVNLELTALVKALGKANTLRLLQNNNPVGEANTELEFVTVHFNLALKPGLNTLIFRAVGATGQQFVFGSINLNPLNS